MHINNNNINNNNNITLLYSKDVSVMMEEKQRMSCYHRVKYNPSLSKNKTDYDCEDRL